MHVLCGGRLQGDARRGRPASLLRGHRFRAMHADRRLELGDRAPDPLPPHRGRAPADPSLKTIVVDPRRTDTAAEADLHLAIAPGTDIALFNAMLHVLLTDDLVDNEYIRRHTEGFERLLWTVRECAPERAASVCGVAAKDIATAARWF